VLRDHHGVARIDEAVQLTVQQVDVRGMQPRGGLVEQVERVPAARPLKFGGELDALRLATGQFGGRLTQP
jgi:hypothetical protein